MVRHELNLEFPKIWGHLYRPWSHQCRCLKFERSMGFFYRISEILTELFKDSLTCHMISLASFQFWFIIIERLAAKFTKNYLMHIYLIIKIHSRQGRKVSRDCLLTIITFLLNLSKWTRQKHYSIFWMKTEKNKYIQITKSNIYNNQHVYLI